MRLFTAVDLPPHVLLKLERLQSVLRPAALIKWSPLDNLHITTKFIGEWPDSRLGELTDALRSVVRRVPFDLELRNLGWFPNDRSPRVLWVGVEREEPLRELSYATEECLLKLGIPKEDRDFTPHLTLARVKSPVPLDKLREKVREMQPADLGVFSVSQFSLFRSDPGSNFSIYRKLHKYDFQSALAVG